MKKEAKSRDPVSLLLEAVQEKRVEQFNRVASMTPGEMDDERKGRRKPMMPAELPLVLLGTPVKMKRRLVKELASIACREGVTVERLAYRMIREHLARKGRAP